MNPMDNQQMLQQISEIRSIGATDKMTSTLDAVLLGQNVSSATNLIGKQVQAMTDAGDKISGTVDKVTIIDGAPRLHVGEETVKLSNVSEIVAGGSDAGDGT
jgi:flagellar basal-body rod modification protein FlgD